MKKILDSYFNNVDMSFSKFEENILELSKSNKFENAKLEWKFAFKNTRHDRCGKCICNKTNLKNVYLYRNEITGEWIECGKGCVKKHKLWELPPNKVLKIFEYFGNGCGWSQPYTPFNHNEYIKNIVVSFEKKAMLCGDYDKLKDLLDKLDIAISNSIVFNDEKILSLRNEINNKLFEIKKKIEEKKRTQEEARRIQEEAEAEVRRIQEAGWQRAKRYRAEAEAEARRIQEEKWEKERLEREKREKKERREQKKKYLEGRQILNFGTKYPDKSYKFVYDNDKNYCNLVKAVLDRLDDNQNKFRDWLEKKKEEKETITHYFHP